MPVTLSSIEQNLYKECIDQGDLFKAWKHAYMKRDCYIFHAGPEFIYWSNVEKFLTNKIRADLHLDKKRTEHCINHAEWWESQWPQSKAFYEYLDSGKWWDDLMEDERNRDR
jgi:hypothetical protein